MNMTDRERFAELRATIRLVVEKRLAWARAEPPERVANSPWLQRYLADVEALLKVMDGPEVEGRVAA